MSIIPGVGVFIQKLQCLRVLFFLDTYHPFKGDIIRLS